MRVQMLTLVWPLTLMHIDSDVLSESVNSHPLKLTYILIKISLIMFE